MTLGCCSLKFFLHGNRSLKGKRRVIKSMRDRIKNKFNVSIAEVGDQDDWQKIHLGIAAVSSDSQYVEGQMNQIVDFIDHLHLAEMTDYKIELIKMGAGNL